MNLVILYVLFAVLDFSLPQKKYKKLKLSADFFFHFFPPEFSIDQIYFRKNYCLLGMEFSDTQTNRLPQETDVDVFKALLRLEFDTLSWYSLNPITKGLLFIQFF